MAGVVLSVVMWNGSEAPHLIELEKCSRKLAWNGKTNCESRGTDCQRAPRRPISRWIYLFSSASDSCADGHSVRHDPAVVDISLRVPRFCYHDAGAARSDHKQEVVA